MDTEAIPGELLMLRGAARWCPDCTAETVFVPVDEVGLVGWCCTSCDAALVLGSTLEVEVSAA